mmetsp:Transcript_15010/g.21011  ORF Transcript_15010/g.21011 Transcript_15010/m.21011 type:complete len:139 (-) Transcript_15010:64-480(-)
MYNLNEKDNKSCLYHHGVIFSPKVPIIKNDAGELLQTPYKVNFLSCPAVNAKAAKKKKVSQKMIEETMYERMDALLSVAVFHGQRVLVLGKWGTGVFGNSEEMIASLFKILLKSKYAGCFERVVFAVIEEESGAFEFF